MGFRFRCSSATHAHSGQAQSSFTLRTVGQSPAHAGWHAFRQKEHNTRKRFFSSPATAGWLCPSTCTGKSSFGAGPQVSFQLPTLAHMEGRMEGRRRGRGRMEGRRARWGGRGTKGTRPRQNAERTRGKMCCGEEGSERTPPSYLTTLHVQSGQLRVCGGRRVVVHVMANRRLHSKRKKRKALATHHVIRIMNSPIK